MRGYGTTVVVRNLGLVSVYDRSKSVGIIAGLLLNTSFLCGAVSNYVSISNLYVYLLVVLGILAIIVNRFVLPIKKPHLILFLIVSLQVFLGVLCVGSNMSQKSFLCVFGVALPCLFVALYSIDIYYLLSAIVISSAVCVPYYFSLLSVDYTVYNSGFQMGVAYSLLPGIIASIIVMLNRKYNGIMRVIGFSVVVLAIMVLFKLQTRGAYLCLFAFVVGYVFIKNQANAFKVVLVFLATVLLVGIVLFFWRDTLFASDWYIRVFGAKRANILNGREIDFAYAFSWRGIPEFLFGSGVGSFQKYTHNEYIHNILGQLLYEQGIYSMVFVLFIIVVGVKIIISNSDNIEIRVFLLMLLCVGIVRLMLSYYFWIDQYFWLFLWLVLGKNYKTSLTFSM